MEYVFSIFWKEFRIGLLYQYKNNFVFFYDQEGIDVTKKMGFDKLIGFPDLNGIYISRNLFPVFDSRVTSSKRSNYNTSKEKINFLIETRGKLVTDNISIQFEGKEYVKRRFQKH